MARVQCLPAGGLGGTLCEDYPTPLYVAERSEAERERTKNTRYTPAALNSAPPADPNGGARQGRSPDDRGEGTPGGGDNGHAHGGTAGGSRPHRRERRRDPRPSSGAADAPATSYASAPRWRGVVATREGGTKALHEGCTAAAACPRGVAAGWKERG